MEAEEIIEQYASGQRDFSLIVLSEVNLSRANLSKANFSGAILSLTNLSGANLSEANLSKAKLNVARLSGANLSKANLSGAVLNVANLIRADLSEANLVSTSLIRSELIRVNFNGADLRNSNLSEADLREASLKQSNLEQADLNGANLRGASLVGANLEGANLHRADLSRADLRGANLGDAELRQANLSQANLMGADLRGANLRWADLNGANLYGADLNDARLSGANLYGANLSEASLVNAILVHADLTQANLIRADWGGADLTGAALTGAKLYAISRFGLKADDLTCDWVDLSPNGDRTQIQKFTTEESRRFFNATPPTVQISIGQPLDIDAHFALADTYRQIANQHGLINKPPNIEITYRRTTLSFRVENDDQLFPIAYAAILPFEDAITTQKNLLISLKILQSQKNDGINVRLANLVGQITVAMTQTVRKIDSIKIHYLNQNLAIKPEFFAYPTQTVLKNSAGLTLTIHHHPDFSKRSIDIPGVTNANKNNISLPTKNSGPTNSLLMDFFSGFN